MNMNMEEECKHIHVSGQKHVHEHIHEHIHEHEHEYEQEHNVSL
jgi:hypothetical protein